MAMSTRANAISREALARLPSLELGELRQQWRGLYKEAAPAHFSRELLMRAVAYRLQRSLWAACGRSRSAGCGRSQERSTRPAR